MRILAVTLLLPLAAWAQSGSSKMSDEHAILAEIESFSKVWNAGDAKGAASFYTDDGVRVGAMGDVQHGRTEIAAAYDKLLHGPFAGARVTQERGSVRMLTRELAIWQGGMQIQPPGDRPPMKGHVVQLMKKAAGRWLILEAHPKLFPPPPK
jgi:uncharacterized protein (TIGR02246 family)